MKKFPIIVTQLFILALIRLRYFRRVRTYMGTADKNIKSPIVIASNHVNRLDPFIIACFLPLKTIFKVFPYKFMTANVYYYRWWKPLAWLAGCYPAKKRYEQEDPNKYGVGRSINLLEAGYSLIMFPEGKRTTQRIEAKPGVSLILDGFKAPLLLCHIDWRRTIPINLKLADSSINTANPDDIMKAIYSLELEG